MSGPHQNNGKAQDLPPCSFEEQGYPAAYALEALDGEELARFREHLPTCAICQSAVADFGLTIAQLPLAVDPGEPSLELRSRILAAVAAESGRDNAAVEAAPLPAPLPLRRRTPQIYAMAAVLLLALGLGQLAWNLNLQGQLRQTRAELGAAQSELATTRWQLAAAQSGQSITGEMIYLRDRQQAVLVINGLPQLGPNQVYEVWLLNEGGAPVPQTVFLTSTTAIQANLDQYQKIAITIEPGPRGSSAPTTPILAVGEPVQ